MKYSSLSLEYASTTMGQHLPSSSKRASKLSKIQKFRSSWDSSVLKYPGKILGVNASPKLSWPVFRDSRLEPKGHRSPLGHAVHWAAVAFPTLMKPSSDPPCTKNLLVVWILHQFCAINFEDDQLIKKVCPWKGIICLINTRCVNRASKHMAKCGWNRRPVTFFASTISQKWGAQSMRRSIQWTPLASRCT